MHAWITQTPDLSEQERIEQKSDADNFYSELQSIVLKRESILDILPSSSDSDTSLSTSTAHFNDRLGKDPSISELRVLIHGLRKRGD